MDAVPETWQRLIRDVKQTTGLTLRFERKPLYEWDVEWCASVPEGHSWGGGDVYFRTFEDALSPEEALGEMIDYLQEQLLHEAIWGGWPTCPTHGTHPLDPVTNESGNCCWSCSEGGYGPVRVGELDFVQELHWRERPGGLAPF